MLGILYDVHGNLPALEAVLAEAKGEPIDEWLLGGDYCAFGPWPVETLARLRELENATWLRGNGERWLVDPPLDMPVEQREFLLAALASAIAELPAEDVDALIGLPTLADRDDAFWCHGSPLSDVESFAPEPARRICDYSPASRSGRSFSATVTSSFAAAARPRPTSSTPAASACRSTVTPAPPGRFAAKAASSSSAAQPTKSRPPWPRCADTTGASA